MPNLTEITLEYEEQLKTISIIARRVQVIEKATHDLYWDLDQFTQKMMSDEIEKQKATEKAKAEIAKDVAKVRKAEKSEVTK